MIQSFIPIKRKNTFVNKCVINLNTTQMIMLQNESKRILCVKLIMQLNSK